MKATIVVITNSFREDSRLIKSLAGKNVLFVYFSQWHYNKHARELFNSNDKSYKTFLESIKHFNYVVDGSLYCFRKECKVKSANRILHEIKSDLLSRSNINEIEVILDKQQHHTDKYLKTIEFDEIIDSTKMVNSPKRTAKSHTLDFLNICDQNKNSEGKIDIPEISAQNISSFLSLIKFDKNNYGINSNYMTTKSVFKSLTSENSQNLLDNYQANRDKINNSLEISEQIQHGIIDPTHLALLIYNYFANTDVDMLSYNTKLSAILRQLSFRDIAIINTESIENFYEVNVNFEEFKKVCKSILTESEYNMANEYHEPIQDCVNETKAILNFQSTYSGNMHNRARMLLGSMFVYSYDTYIQGAWKMLQYMNNNMTDSKSANNLMSCIGLLRSSYGKPLKMRPDNAYKKLGVNFKKDVVI